MTIEDYDILVKAVKQMRDAQRTYFKTRAPSDLRAAKAFEARVDKMLDANAKKDKQASLF